MVNSDGKHISYENNIEAKFIIQSIMSCHLISEAYIHFVKAKRLYSLKNF